MAGTDGLNAQGIINSKYVRSCFTLQDPGTQLDGGDFESFEVCISAAVYKDKGLEDDLKSGKKIHALLAEALFPDQGLRFDCRGCERSRNTQRTGCTGPDRLGSARRAAVSLLAAVWPRLPILPSAIV